MDLSRRSGLLSEIVATCSLQKNFNVVWFHQKNSPIFVINSWLWICGHFQALKITGEKQLDEILFCLHLLSGTSYIICSPEKFTKFCGQARDGFAASENWTFSFTILTHGTHIAWTTGLVFGTISRWWCQKKLPEFTSWHYLLCKG